jgi:acetoin utilization deacetylase AcuC-like enzyme
MKDLALFYPKGHEAHYEAGHPERPERIEAIRAALQEAGLWEYFPQVEPLDLPVDVCHNIHSPTYLSYLKKASESGQHLDADTYTNPATWDLAFKAAGGAAAIAEAVWNGEARRGLALTRPPGHHATYERGMGFCLLNNIALAAEYLIGQKGASNIAIVDLDVHHGNGTQDIFWLREDVFFLSIHQAPLYPGSGRIDERGGGIGEGTTVNIPMPPYSGDQGYRAATDDVILPLVQRYGPQMILVSVGFDTHWKDPLANQLLSAAGYAGIIAELARLADETCGGRIALYLEGGYDLEAGAACMVGAVSEMLNREWTDPLGPSPHAEREAWGAVIQKIRAIWQI